MALIIERSLPVIYMDWDNIVSGMEYCDIIFVETTRITYL
jgi:hypothetical protein